MSKGNVSQPDTTPSVLPSLNERFFAMTAHFSQFLGYFLIILAISLFIPDFFPNPSLELGSFLVGPIICLVIYLFFKNRSHYTSFQSLQASIFQFVLFMIIGVIDAVFWESLNGSEALLPAMCMIPFLLIWFLIALVGGIQSMRGRGFEYPILGKWLTRHRS